MARLKEIGDDQILEAARKLFISKGLSASTKDIAASIGISQGVLFQRFGSKKQLISAALAPRPIDPEADVQRVSGHADPARAFENVVAALFAILRQQAPASLPVLSGAADAGPTLGRSDGVFLRCHRALETYLADETRAGRIQGDAPGSAAFLLVAALHHAAVFEAVCGPTPHVNEQAARRMAQVVWRGLMG